MCNMPNPQKYKFVGMPVMRRKAAATSPGTFERKIGIGILRFVIFRDLEVVLLACVILSGCSRPSLDDELAKAKQYRTIAKLEVWLGEPTAVKPFHNLERRELPDGATFIDADGDSLGHGEYSVAVQSSKEVREYKHPDNADVRFFVTAVDGKIQEIAITRNVKMIDEPGDLPKSRN